MAFDAEFIEGFDKYGPAGIISCQGGATTLSTLLTSGEWTSAVNSSVLTIAAPLGTTYGQALQLSGGSLGNASTLTKSLPGNYARIIGGFWFSGPLLSNAGCVFLDGSTAQLGIFVETTGKISIREGSNGATVLATSTASISAGTAHTISFDITFNTSTGGSYTVWLDGVAILGPTSGVRTAYGTSNNYANAFQFLSGAFTSNLATFDHLYLHMFLAGGSGDTALLTNPIVKTDFMSSDNTVQFTKTAAVLGQDYSLTASTNAPGANQLALRPFKPVANMTLNSIGLLPQATSAGANLQGVAYADSSGVPGALLSAGPQVTGTTSGTPLTLTLTTPQALTAGTQYWIGYITDTSVVASQVDNTTNTGQKAANTYGSGAPGTAPTMTGGQPSWMVWGNCTPTGANFSQVTPNPGLGASSCNSSSTVGNTDLFNAPTLPSGITNIYTVALKAFCGLTGGGARTMDMVMKSGVTTGNGNNTAISVGASFGYLDSYFDTDPNTSAAWTPSGLNAALPGYSINS